MRRLRFLPALALAACAAAPPPAQAEGEAGACAVEVRFGSYAMGIDRGAAAAAERLIAGYPAVTGVSRSGYGREGEYALCVQTASTDAALALFRQIRAAIPPRPRGPILLTGPEVRFSAPRK